MDLAHHTRSTLRKLLHSAGFLPLLFVVLSITLWLMFINNYYQRNVISGPLKATVNVDVPEFSSQQYFEQQRPIKSPEEKIQDIQALTMQLMEKYQDKALADDKQYIESLETKFTTNVGGTSLKNKEELADTQHRELNQMKLKQYTAKPDSLQHRVNSLLNQNDSQDADNTDYMNRLNLDTVTTVIKKS